MTYHPFTPVTLCSVCKLAETENPDHQPPVTSSPVTRTFWVHWNSTVKNDAAGRLVVQREAARRSFLLLNAWDAWMIPVVRAVNPAVKCLVYKDASSTRSYDNNPDAFLLPCGVRYSTAPSAWFAKDASGRRIEYAGYAGHWLMDVGHPDYQAEWKRNVMGSITRDGWDGVLVDNLLWTRDQYGPIASGTYASDAAMREDYKDFLFAVRPGGMALGDRVPVMIGNMSNARLEYGRWSDYLALLDGGWDEWWLTFSDTDRQGNYAEGFPRIVNEVALCEAAGKVALVQPHCSAAPGGQVAFDYALSSFLLYAGSQSAFCEVNRTDGYGNPVTNRPALDWDLGAAVSKATTTPAGLVIRDFQKATVLVNPTGASLSVAFSSPMRRPDGSMVAANVSVVTRSKEGQILRKV